MNKVSGGASRLAAWHPSGWKGQPVSRAGRRRIVSSQEHKAIQDMTHEEVAAALPGGDQGRCQASCRYAAANRYH